MVMVDGERKPRDLKGNHSFFQIFASVYLYLIVIFYLVLLFLSPLLECGLPEVWVLCARQYLEWGFAHSIISVSAF